MTVEDEYSDGEESRKREVIPHSGAHTDEDVCPGRCGGQVAKNIRLEHVSIGCREESQKKKTNAKKIEAIVRGWENQSKRKAYGGNAYLDCDPFLFS